MIKDMRESTDLACPVCGHQMGPYVRICDKCGSIRRPFKGGGRRRSPEELGNCVRCGAQVPLGDKLCVECAEYVKQKTTRPRRFTLLKVTATLIGVLSFAVVVASVVAIIVLEGVTGYVVMLAISALLLVLCAVSLLMAFREPGDKT